MKNKKLLLVCALIGILLVMESRADTVKITTVGRYLSVPNDALVLQVDPLQETIQVRFPASVKTVCDAMYYLLRFSGYRLVNESQLILQAKELLVLPLPQSNRRLGPMSLKTALLTLAGQPFGLLVDPVHRLISFRLLPNYAVLCQK